MVGAVKNVEKTQVDEAEGGLVPARVEPDEAGIPGEFERANFAARWHKTKNSDDAQAQARERGMDGKTRLFRLDWVFEQHVEHGLVPIDIGVVRKRGASDVGERIVIRSERAVGRKRDAGRDDLRL